MRWLLLRYDTGTMLVVPYKPGVAVQFNKPIVKYIKSQYSKVCLCVCFCSSRACV